MNFLIFYKLLHIMVFIIIQVLIWFRDSLRVDDWDSAQLEVMRLQEQDKVIFHQPYAPKHPEKTKRPFVKLFKMSS